MTILGIGLPVYNDEESIGDILDCILSQTFQDFELHIYDNCSTDNTINILKEYQKKENRIILIKSNNKSYAAESRNKGINIAKGEFVAFMDSDDFYPDTKVLADLYETAKRENAIKISINGTTDTSLKLRRENTI